MTRPSQPPTYDDDGNGLSGWAIGGISFVAALMIVLGSFQTIAGLDRGAHCDLRRRLLRRHRELRLRPRPVGLGLDPPAALALIGRLDDALANFEELLAVRNALGLLAGTSATSGLALRRRSGRRRRNAASRGWPTQGRPLAIV